MLRGLYRTKVIHGFNTMLILYCFFLGVCYKSHKSLFNEYIEKRSGDDGDNWTAKRPRTMMARDRDGLSEKGECARDGWRAREREETGRAARAMKNEWEREKCLHGCFILFNGGV